MNPAQAPCRRRAIYAMREAQLPAEPPPPTPAPAAEAQVVEIKRKGGWPKGKPRKPR